MLLARISTLPNAVKLPHLSAHAKKLHTSQSEMCILRSLDLVSYEFADFFIAAQICTAQHIVPP